MADRIIAGQTTPSSPHAIHQQDAADVLENKLSQLQSLLSCCYGDGAEWFDAIGMRHRDNIMWIAADLAGDITRLAQELLKRVNAISPSKT
ncbi:MULTISPECIES: hypothetical protein [Variovorax]|uniref:hypothetical protein n=1 Tax=Variovorax TaxID=34072 RepID=UPI0028580067|nr:hypothetical protein [Variovorax sp. 3319]MDR6889158.1 hypothetical protein [Variovorax sp. 3319]